MTHRRKIRFVRALVGGAVALINDVGLFQINLKTNQPSLENDDVRELISDGVLSLKDKVCSATPLARNWIKRHLASKGAGTSSTGFAEQHSDIRNVQGSLMRLNINEGPLLRLSYSRNGRPPFLQSHHLLAAKKIETLVARTQMLQRTTMSYDPTRIGQGNKSSGLGPDLGDNALDARRKLQNCLDRLPLDCAGVVMDVCGFQKGLQLIETERKWPRRSAKLILRVGLEQLCAFFEFAPTIIGEETNLSQFWMGEDARPKSFKT